MPDNALSRRSVFRTLSLPAAALLFPRAAAAEVAASPAPALLVDEPVCVLTPQSVEGPFYLDPDLLRADIADGRPGVPLQLQLRLVEAGSCAPIRNARLDVWHADARGVYSGFKEQGDGRHIDATGQKFLRGTQISDERGRVVFNTIYPGWYEGRATHIHAKLFLDDKTVLLFQMYFPDAINEFIHTNVLWYANRNATRQIINRNDPLILENDPERRSFCAVKETADRYVASLVIGVDRAAPAAAANGPSFTSFFGRALGLSSGPPPAANRVSSLIPGL